MGVPGPWPGATNPSAGMDSPFTLRLGERRMSAKEQDGALIPQQGHP